MRVSYPQMMKYCFNVESVVVGESLMEIQKPKVTCISFLSLQ